MTETKNQSYSTQDSIGACNHCGCGNRPGPWHKEDCVAYMPDPNDFSYLRHKENTDENQSTK